MPVTAINNPAPEAPDNFPTKLERGGYLGTAQTLDQKIDENLAAAKLLIESFKTTPFLGSITPTSTATGTGRAFWLATQAGTYTNFGSVVVAANSFAVISRNEAGVFSISQTALDLSTYASKSYVDGLVVGLLDDRGSYNASVNTFPTTGGSGTAGAVMKGDLWYVSVAGTLGGKAVRVGSSFRAMVDAPAQVATNWSIFDASLGYIPENTTNKNSNIAANPTSTDQFPTNKGVVDYVAANGGAIKPFIDGAWLINSQVNFLGKDWYNTVATVAGEIPGTSIKWVDRLSAYGEKIVNKSANLLNTSGLLKGLNPNADGTWAGNGSAAYYGYSFVAPFTDFYTIENINTFLIGYVFDASGVKIRDIAVNKGLNIFLNKGEKHNLTFKDNTSANKITCRKDTNLTVNDIASTEYDFRTENILKNNYFNFIDANKLIAGQYNTALGANEPNALSKVTPPTKISKGVYYRIGARLAGSFDVIFNADGSFSRSVNVGNLGVIEFVGNETYISMSFSSTETEIGLCNRNIYIAFGTFEAKPSAVFSDLQIPSNTDKASYDCIISPNATQSTCIFALSFDTSKRVFALNDVVTISGNFKPLAIQSAQIKFGWVSTSDGKESETYAGSFELVTKTVTVDTYVNAEVSFTVTQALINTLNKQAEIGLTLAVYGLTDFSDWRVLCDDLVLKNVTKGFSINKVTNINRIFSYYNKLPSLVSGVFFKPTTISTPKLITETALDVRNLKGKRVLLIGDSHTEGTGGRYTKHIQAITGGAVTNIGSSGAAISRMIALLTGWTEFDASGKDLGVDITKFDVVTIMSGTNGGDFTGNMSTAYTENNVFQLPKTINAVNYTNPKDFFLAFFATGYCNNYSVLIQFIQYYNPACKIYLITPPVRTTNVTLASERLVQLKSIAEYYGLEIINAYQNTGMNLINFLSKYSSDGTHFNALGNDIWGKYIGNEINKSV